MLTSSIKMEIFMEMVIEKPFGVKEKEIFTKAKEAFYLNPIQKKMSDKELKEFIINRNNMNISSTHIFIESLFNDFNPAILERFTELSSLYDTPEKYKQLISVIMNDLKQLLRNNAFTCEFLDDDVNDKQMTNFLIYSICKKQFNNEINLEPDYYLINFHFIYNFLLEHDNFSFSDKLTDDEEMILYKYSNSYSIKEIRNSFLSNNIDITENETINIINNIIPKKLGLDNCFQSALLYNYQIYKEDNKNATETI